MFVLSDHIFSFPHPSASIGQYFFKVPQVIVQVKSYKITQMFIDELIEDKCVRTKIQINKFGRQEQKD